MNRAIKEATVKRCHHDHHQQLERHPRDFIQAYNFARRLKTLNGLTPYEYLCKLWTNDPERFTMNSIQKMPGLNNYPNPDTFNALGEDGFYQRLQSLADQLQAAGKTVFIVAENPVLHTDIRNMVEAQPLRPFKPPKPESRTAVLRHQEKYLNALNRIRGATVIHSLDAFCPGEECLLFDENGLPLYADDDHLSRWVGGRFLVERVLKPYLERSTN
jgi:putative transposase